LVEQPVLDGRPNDRSSSLRPEGAAALAAVKEGIHLLANHICGFSDATGKKLRGFQGRGTDLMNACQAEVMPCTGLDPLPKQGVLRQEVDHAAETLQLLRHQSALLSALNGIQSAFRDLDSTSTLATSTPAKRINGIINAGHSQKTLQASDGH
jgi:hypothetical protein